MNSEATLPTAHTAASTCQSTPRLCANAVRTCAVLCGGSVMSSGMSAYSPSAPCGISLKKDVVNALASSFWRTVLPMVIPQTCLNA